MITRQFQKKKKDTGKIAVLDLRYMYLLLVEKI